MTTYTIRVEMGREVEEITVPIVPREGDWLWVSDLTGYLEVTQVFIGSDRDRDRDQITVMVRR